jgi:hypothetical protein
LFEHRDVALNRSKAHREQLRSSMTEYWRRIVRFTMSRPPVST